MLEGSQKLHLHKDESLLMKDNLCEYQRYDHTGNIIFFPNSKCTVTKKQIFKTRECYVRK